ncbi:MAG: GMC family oxidoreductase [Rhizobium sp.]|nr:GMC family oxidoreductase [Rhizobium sp.]
MAIRDLRTAPAGLVLHTDVAVIGGGPAGLAIARELCGTRIRVTVVDSGGFEDDRALDSLNTVERVGAQATGQTLGRGYSGSLAWLNAIPAFELRHRGLGGSTRTWIGKCAAFDEIDLEKRRWVPASGWPISHGQLMPYLDRAAELLNLGPNVYDHQLYGLLRSPPDRDMFGDDRLRPFFWQFSHEPGSSEPMRFKQVARRADAHNIDFLTHATVTRIDTDEGGGRVRSVTVRNDHGGHAVVHAPMIVLCAGGIENPRILLASPGARGGGLGNQHGVVGRYLADHPRAMIASVPDRAITEVSRIFTFYGLADPAAPNFYLHGFSLSPTLQRSEGLLNCAAYPVQTLAQDDPWHALRRLSGRPGKDMAADLWHVLRSPGLIAAGAFERLHRRRGLPRKAAALRFDALVEQRPNPQSRVTLSRHRDRHGVAIPRVDWRIGEHEVRSLCRLAEEMAAAFSRAGLPEPLLPDWVLQGNAQDVPLADMAHPSGTTRMGTDVRSSVVDANCMVHGVEGLFIAGSSVFPTSGHANPTLMIVSLALRLADHLRAYVRTAGEQQERTLPKRRASGVQARALKGANLSFQKP